ncbi:MAG: hypothetical protein LBI02_02605 [Opitutaceae bacterium]|jgi:hypothetical protein|nr:hypothetical protein [Opitutaceae bacterium]
MKRTRDLLLFHGPCCCAIALLLAACASPARLLEKGHYYQAASEAARTLRAKPGDTAAQNVLLKAYPLAVKTALREIQTASSRGGLEKHDMAIAKYGQLNRLADEIHSAPDANRLIPRPREFHAELQQARNTAAEDAYNRGIDALNNNTLEQARTAYHYFKKTNTYADNYRDAAARLREAARAATLRVIVEPPKMPANLQLSADFFYSELMADFDRRNRGQLVRFYTPEEAKNENMRAPHQYMTLDFGDFSIGHTKESSNTVDVKRDNVIVGSVKVDGKDLDARATVKAKFTTFQREIISTGTLRIRILRAPGGGLADQRAFAGKHIWSTVWGGYTGDDRALSPEQKHRARTQPKVSPQHQDLFVEFTRPIYPRAIEYIRSAYQDCYVNQTDN